MENDLTTLAVAQLLGVSRARVRKLIQEGRLVAKKHGRDLLIQEAALQKFLATGRKKRGRPGAITDKAVSRDAPPHPAAKESASIKIGNGTLYTGDALQILPQLPANHFQSIIADPPYFQVLLDQPWDNTWQSAEDYLEWTQQWVLACKRILKEDGLLFLFGQLGKREHVWLHICSLLAKQMQFHDMLIWDRAVGYNERSDSFTPQYEMILVLRKSADIRPYFDKDAVRVLYPEEKIQTYLRDKRYKNQEARERHLRKGKYATNILRVPSLKGSSREKIGHPSQKPIALIQQLIAASTRPQDSVFDPFLGSGTTAAAAESLGRKWVGIEKDHTYAAMTCQRIAKLNANGAAETQTHRGSGA